MTRDTGIPIFLLNLFIAWNFSTIGRTLPGLQYMISRTRYMAVLRVRWAFGESRAVGDGRWAMLDDGLDKRGHRPPPIADRRQSHRPPPILHRPPLQRFCNLHCPSRAIVPSCLPFSPSRTIAGGTRGDHSDHHQHEGTIRVARAADERPGGGAGLLHEGHRLGNTEIRRLPRGRLHDVDGW